MRSKVALVALAALVAATALGACTKNTGNEDVGSTSVHKNTGGISTNPADSQGPAPAVAGAKRGGTLNYLMEADFEHLDPQRTYVVQAMAVEQLFARTLTMFKQGKNGKLTLVGDLATGPGTDVNGDCKTWKYTLKSGLKYQDGSTITARDVAYGISRSYSPNLSEGPHYLAQWLSNSSDYNAKYKGPYNGGAPIAPGLKVQGDKTLIFNFKQPHCDLPFALQLPTSAPVPQSKDTGPNYDNHPFSSGPYQIKQYTRGTQLVLERNKYWDPKSDPIRHNYPDTINVTFGDTDVQQANRIIAENGSDQYAVAEDNVPQSLISRVEGDPSLSSRTITGQEPFVFYLAINTQHVKDLKERQAMEYAVNRKSLIQVLGGSALGTPATTLESPTTIGWKNYDAYPGGDTGNPAKAKKLLGGKHPTIVFGYRNTALGQRQEPAIVNALQRAGFKVVSKPIDDANYFTELGDKSNPYDLYLSDWAADWPTGSAVIPVLCDGRTIVPGKGNNVVSYYNNNAFDKEIDKASVLPADKSAPEWARLDKEYVSRYATVIPMYYSRSYAMEGSKVGGVYLSTDLGTSVFTNAYVK